MLLFQLMIAQFTYVRLTLQSTRLMFGVTLILIAGMIPTPKSVLIEMEDTLLTVAELG